MLRDSLRLDKICQIDEICQNLVFQKYITLHWVIRQIDLERSNNVTQGRLELPTWHFRCHVISNCAIGPIGQLGDLIPVDHPLKLLPPTDHYVFPFQISETDLATSSERFMSKLTNKNSKKSKRNQFDQILYIIITEMCLKSAFQEYVTSVIQKC